MLSDPQIISGNVSNSKILLKHNNELKANLFVILCHNFLHFSDSSAILIATKCQFSAINLRVQFLFQFVIVVLWIDLKFYFIFFIMSIIILFTMDKLNRLLNGKKPYLLCAFSNWCVQCPYSVFCMFQTTGTKISQREREKNRLNGIKIAKYER